MGGWIEGWMEMDSERLVWVFYSNRERVCNAWNTEKIPNRKEITWIKEKRNTNNNEMNS